MSGQPPGSGRGNAGNDDGDSNQNQPGRAAACAAGAAALPTQQPLFRYWVDELLWSQGRTATIVIEEVLDQMGGHRTGGPNKLPQKAASDPSTQHLLQHMKLSDQQAAPQQQQWRQGSSGQLGGGQPAVSGITAPVSRSSSEATILSSRTSSANSLDAAVAAAAVESGLPAAELRTLQPASLAALNSSSSPAVSVPAADAAAAAAAASSDSMASSEDPTLPAGSSSMGGGQLGPTKRLDDHLLGYHHVRSWDILWTKSVYAIRAARQLQQGQIVSAIAGLNCLSMKKRMVQTLRMALGAQAFQIVPLSFCLPEDLPAWQSWLASPQGAAADTGLWMLKTGQDAGRGLKLVRTQQALQVAVRPPKNPTKPQTHLKVAQQYVTDPLLLQGRKFHLRLWLLVTSHQPLRAYLHNQGLVLFSSESYDPRRPLDGGHGVRPSASHITNYARNEDSMVWDLPRLQQQLGEANWARLWAQMRQASALTAAAVLGPLRAAHRWLQPSVSNYGFQMMGLDFLIDEALHPWLLEVNSAPSIMAIHSDPDTCALIKSTKQAMLGDMLAMVQHRVLGGSSDGCGSSGSTTGASALPWREELAAEMANRGGFEPIMGIFPVQSPSSGSGSGSSGSSKGFNIPWQEVDVQLQHVMQQQYPHC